MSREKTLIPLGRRPWRTFQYRLAKARNYCFKYKLVKVGWPSREWRN